MKIEGSPQKSGVAVMSGMFSHASLSLMAQAGGAGGLMIAVLAPIAMRASATPSRPLATASTAKRPGAAEITCSQDRPIEPVAPSNTSRFGRAEPSAPAAFI